MSKKCSRLRWATKPASFANGAYFIFFMVFNEKPHTFSLLFRRDVCGLSIYTVD